MKTIEVEVKQLTGKDKQAFMGKPTDISLVNNVIDLNEETEPVMVVDKDTGEKLVYCDDLVGYDPDVVLDFLDSLEIATDNKKGRLGTGVKNSHIQIGFMPANGMRGNYCTPTRYYTKALQYFGYYMSVYGEHMFKEKMPELYEEHAVTMQNLANDELKIAPESLFTSAVINKNNDIQFHIDRGNTIPGTTLLCYFLKDVKGGATVVPEIDLAYIPKHNGMVIFDGYRFIHGVQPIEKLTEDAARYSIVYYSKKELFKCQTSLSDEKEHANEVNNKILLNKQKGWEKVRKDIERHREKIEENFAEYLNSTEKDSTDE